MTTESTNWGGARRGSGPKVRNIHLDDETTDMLRILSKQSGVSEQAIVANLIRREWEQLDRIFQAAAVQHDGE